MEISRGNVFQNRSKMLNRPSSPAFSVSLMSLGSTVSNMSSPSKYNFRTEGMTIREPVDDNKYNQLSCVCQQMKEKITLLRQKESLLVELSIEEQSLRKCLSQTKGKLNREFSDDYISVSVLLNEGTKRVNKLQTQVKEFRRHYLGKVSEEEDTINELIRKMSQLDSQDQNSQKQKSTVYQQQPVEVKQLKHKIQDKYSQLKQVRSKRESKLKDHLRGKVEKECQFKVKELKLNQKLNAAKQQLDRALLQSTKISDNFAISRKQIGSQIDSRRQREEMSQHKHNSQHLLKVQMGLTELHKLLKSYTEEYLLDVQEIQHLKNAIQSQKTSAETIPHDHFQAHRLQGEIADSEFLLSDLNIEEAQLLSKVYNLQAKVQINMAKNLDHSQMLRVWSQEQKEPLPNKIDLKVQLKELTLRYVLQQHKKKQVSQTRKKIQIMERWNREIETNIGATNYDKIEQKKKEIQMYREQIQVLEAEIIRNDHEQAEIDLKTVWAYNYQSRQQKRRLDPQVVLTSLFLCLMIWVLW